MIRFETTLGDFTVKLDEESAPISCRNFLRYVDDGHFDGTIFHRVIPGFMIQGGGFDGSMKQKPTRAPIQNEAANGAKNATGTIAMARTNDPDSASSQVYLMLGDSHFLNGQYTAFGRVVSGMDVVDKIKVGDRVKTVKVN